MSEIRTLEDFRFYKGKEGFFVITDITGNRIHKSDCNDVKERYFAKKVIRNKGKNGSYFFTNILTEAVTYSKGIEQCKKCLS